MSKPISPFHVAAVIDSIGGLLATLTITTDTAGFRQLAHAGTPVLMLIHDRAVSVSNANTGEIIAEHTIDPARNYQPRRH